MEDLDGADRDVNPGDMSPEQGEAGAVELSDPHVVAAVLYCRSIVAGEIPASVLTVAACRRQLDDLERWATDPAYPYRFDEHAAGRVCRFLEMLPHIKGPKANAGELLHLEDWQCFVVTTVYGWKRKATGRRRFRHAYLEVARGNGKSSLLSGLALYSLAADGEQGAEVVSAATTRDQARIVFGVAQEMLRKRREIATRLGLRDTQHAITHHRTASSFKPLSREADNQDGLNVHFACIDELHAHRTREVFDVIETGLGKRDQSLLFVITTAGTDVSGICYEVRSYCVKVLERTVEDDSQFAVIYTVDVDKGPGVPGDDWRDPANWPKANPNWGVSVDTLEIEQLAKKARETPSAQNNFKTKHLNIWCSADSAWMDLDRWDACADRSLSIDAFAGEDMWIGFDLASKTDICCRAKLFHKDLVISPATETEPAKVERHWYLFVDSYLPEETVELSSNASYRGWVIEGHIKTTPGAVLDFEVLRRDTLADRDRFRIREAPFDPAQATQFATEMLAEDVPMVEFRQTVLMMSEPMKELEALARSGRLHHDGNPALRWMVSNVVCHMDAKDNIYPRKARHENKIDGAVASIMAIGRAIVSDKDPDPYLTRGIRTIG